MNIMVTLEHVLKSGNFISADFFFNRDSERGRAVYDIEKGEVVEATFDGRNIFEEPVYGFIHVIGLFRQMVEYNNYPETAHCMWY